MTVSAQRGSLTSASDPPAQPPRSLSDSAMIVAGDGLVLVFRDEAGGDGVEEQHAIGSSTGYAA